MNQLICDYRERAIIPLLPNWVITENLAVGDFAIKKDGEIKYVFERKTWKDFAASIKDGRIKEQSKNMSTLGCAVYIIFEGKCFYEPETIIAGIEFRKLDAMRHKLMISGIPHVQTKTPVHTARFLTDFYERVITYKREINGAAENKILDKKISTIEEIKDKILLKIAGVGESLLPNIRHLFGEIIKKNITSAALAEIKYVTSGRRIGLKGAEKILNYDECAVLSAFPGISPSSAVAILGNNTMAEICGMSEGKIAEIYKTTTRRIGAATAKKIYEILHN